MVADIKTLDGKLYKFEPHPELNCCLANFFRCIVCECFGPATALIKVKSDTHVISDEAQICGGNCPMTPIPCCAFLGYGGLAAKWEFKKGEGDKWVGFGSVFKCDCCTPCTNHNGDTWTYSDEFTGTKEKPFAMIAGMNPVNPPCFIGRKVLILYEVADRKGSAGGAPPTEATMSRA